MNHEAKGKTLIEEQQWMPLGDRPVAVLIVQREREKPSPDEEAEFYSLSDIRRLMREERE